MKTNLQLLFFAALLLVGIQARSQCNAAFNYTVSPGGTVSFRGVQWVDSFSTYTIYYGDGTSASSAGYPGFQHTYATSGTYTVCVYDTNTTAGCTTSACDTVAVNLCQGAAQFSYNTVGFGDIAFNDPNLGSLPGATVLWSFGDNTTSTSTSPSHQYSSSGNYNVCLTVSYAGGSCADTTCWDTLSVGLCQFNPGFDTADISFNPATLGFYAQDPHSSYNYSWAFGDGSTGTGDSIQHTFTSAGTYTISVSISDAGTGCSVSASRTLGISRCGLNGNFGVGSNGLNATFYCNITDSMQGQTLSYQWNFPGGTPPTGNASSVSVTYSQLGTYNACLYLSNNTGCTDTICQSFTLTPPVYSISGQITAGGSGTCGVVYLIVQDSVGHLALIDSILNPQGIDTMTCSGYYAFNNLSVDTYYVKAALEPNDPNYANYLPTYFNGQLTWSAAMSLGLTGNATGINIDLIAGNNPGGPGFVAGYVSQGAGLIIGGTSGTGTGTNSSSGHHPENPGQALVGIQINLTTAADQAVAYTYTDANGHYQFAHLALGSYKIYAEELNKIANPILFTLTQDNPTDSSIDISINSHSATGIDALNNIQINNIYPNPVLTTLHLQVASTQSANAVLKLVDVLGRTTFEKTVKLSGGQNTEEVDMQALAAGVYQLVIQTGSKQVTYKVVKAR